MISPGRVHPDRRADQRHRGAQRRSARRAAREAAHWPDVIRLSFNLSAVQLCSVRSAAADPLHPARRGLDPVRLQIEVTETALLADFAVARDNLDGTSRRRRPDRARRFRRRPRLHLLPARDAVRRIKLDGSLITTGADTVRGRRLLKGVIDLCASLGLPCVAEHIETESTADLLRELGCRDGQGFLLSPPLEANCAAKLATTNRPQTSSTAATRI